MISLMFWEGSVVKQRICELEENADSMTINTLNHKSYPVYVPEIMVLLTTRDIPTTEGSVVDGVQLIKDYGSGFEEGVKHFETNYTNKIEALGSSAELLIKNLHSHYYHEAPEEKIGWYRIIFNKVPPVANSQFLKQAGFYAGIEQGLQKAKKLYPIQFKDFDKCPDEEVTTVDTKSEITTARQVLIIHYLLKECMIDSSPSDNPTEATRLYQFVTGKEQGAKRIQDTNLYKKAKQPFKHKDAEVIRDLQVIRPYFENLGLTRIVALIDKDMKVSLK